jgi:hypothetical protein
MIEYISIQKRIEMDIKKILIALLIVGTISNVYGKTKTNNIKRDIKRDIKKQTSEITRDIEILQAMQSSHNIKYDIKRDAYALNLMINDLRGGL